MHTSESPTSPPASPRNGSPCGLRPLPARSSRRIRAGARPAAPASRPGSSPRPCQEAHHSEPEEEPRSRVEPQTRKPWRCSEPGYHESDDCQDERAHSPSAHAHALTSVGPQRSPSWRSSPTPS